MKKYKISFCTSCTGRLHHIKETFLSNLNNNIDYGDVEFVLLNWNSQDGLNDWVQHNLSEYINDGVVKYLHTKQASHFQMARTKNVTAKNASGEIVCWVDGDNFIQKDYASYINTEFNKNEEIILNSIKRKRPRQIEKLNWGRIAISKKNFMKVNGYDENFDGWGWEERDFKNRVIKFLGIRDVQFRRADLDFISHENTFNRPKRSNLDNKRKSRLNMENERYIVNTDIDFGSIDDLKITGGRSW
jgi:predicted glycosyltransferase involved in capsule biosynthesis